MSEITDAMRRSAGMDKNVPDRGAAPAAGGAGDAQGWAYTEIVRLRAALADAEQRSKALEDALGRVIERLESHEEYGCCKLDARDRTAIRQSRRALSGGGTPTQEGRE